MTHHHNVPTMDSPQSLREPSPVLGLVGHPVHGAHRQGRPHEGQLSRGLERALGAGVDNGVHIGNLADGPVAELSGRAQAEARQARVQLGASGLTVATDQQSQHRLRHRGPPKRRGGEDQDELESARRWAGARQQVHASDRPEVPESVLAHLML